MLINTVHNETYSTQNTPCRVVATPSFRNSVDKPSTSAGLCFVMENEVWKPITQFPGYEISSLGRVKSIDRVVKSCYGKTAIKKGKIKTLITTVWGYASVRLTKDGYTNNYVVHRLVAQVFIPNPENKPCVNHLNSDRLDNRVENLQWCNHKENTEHAMRHGNFKPVRYFTGYKTTDDQKIEMYLLHKNGESVNDLAKKYKISPRNVRYNITNSFAIKNYLQSISNETET